MSRLRRADLGEGFGYTPGEQPPDGSDWLKLNTNESPLPPSERVAAAVSAAAAELRRYPSPLAEPLRSRIARHHDVAPEQVIVLNGADQVLDTIFRAFLQPGDRVVTREPSYSLFPVLAAVFSVRLVRATTDEDFAQRDAPLRILVNPNSPTGRWLAPAQIAEICAQSSGILVIDEAYCDFAPESCISTLAGHDNWLVVRSLSKSHALAGLRVGYAVAGEALIDDLLAVKDSYPVDRAAIAGAVAALDDTAHHQRIVECVLQQRDRLTAALRERGWDVPESFANFVFARPPHGDALAVLQELRDCHILVRHFDAPGLADRLRITIGSPEEMDRLLSALR